MRIKLFGYLLFVSVLFSCTPSGPEWEYKERIMTPSANPYGITWFEGEVVISSPATNEIVYLDKEKVIRSRNNDFNSPKRIAVLEDQLIVAESGADRVALVKRNRPFYYPMTVVPDKPMAASFGVSRVAVANYNKHQIIYFKGGKDLSFGENGTEHGQFKYPTDVQIFGSKIFVADNLNGRVQVFDDEGGFLKTIGENEGLQQASGIYVYSEGIIVCDRKASQVIWFDHNGQKKQVISEGFETPSDAVVVGNTLYVSDEEGGFVGVLNMM